MLTIDELDGLNRAVKNKAEGLRDKEVWITILKLLNEAAPLIFEKGALKWWDIPRAFKLAKLLYEFIVTLTKLFNNKN